MKKIIFLLLMLISIPVWAGDVQQGEDIEFLDGAQLLYPIVHPVASAPTAKGDGQLYFDTTTKKIVVRANSAWQTIVGQNDNITTPVLLFGAASGSTLNSTTSITTPLGTIATLNTGTSNASVSYATTAANALMLNASTVIVGGGVAASGAELTVNGDSYHSGKLGVNTTTLNDGYIEVARDVSATDFGNADLQLVVKGKSDETKQLLIGFETTNNYAIIQTIDNGVSWTAYPLVLQKYGGFTGVCNSFPATALDVIGTVSATAFIDSTPYFTGDALKEISEIKINEKGEIDHSSLGQARFIVDVTKESVLVKNKAGKMLKEIAGIIPTDKENLLIQAGITESIADVIIEQKTEVKKVDARDLGMSVSRLEEAIRQLIVKNEKLEKALAVAGIKVEE